MVVKEEYVEEDDSVKIVPVAVKVEEDDTVKKEPESVTKEEDNTVREERTYGCQGGGQHYQDRICGCQLIDLIE